MFKTLLNNFLFFLFSVALIIIIVLSLLMVPKEYLLAVILIEIIIYVISIFFFTLTNSSRIEKQAKKDTKKDVLEKIDFGKYKNYYRDIIKNYNPLILNYIDNYEITNNSIAAILLALEKKEIISIKNKEIEVLKNNNLSITEELIINNIKNGKLYINATEIKEAIIEEANALLKKNPNKNNGITTFELTAIAFALLLLSTILISTDYFIIGIILLLLIMFIAPIIISYKTDYDINKLKYIRNKKGKEINIKLEGLKNYIKEFSTLDKRKKEELELWDYYLIYAVMFNINKDIIEEYEDYFILE